MVLKQLKVTTSNKKSKERVENRVTWHLMKTWVKNVIATIENELIISKCGNKRAMF